MTTIQIHNQIKEDAAYIWSRDNQDITNMALVLRAYGFKYTANACIAQVDFIET